MQKPSWKEVSEAAGIGQSYASMVVAGSRTPPRSLAILLFRRFGWRHDVIADLSEDQMRALEEIEPWTPPKERQERAA